MHIPYKGSGPAMAAIAGGEINSLMSGSALVPLVQDGRLRGLAITGTKRLPGLLGVPTFAGALATRGANVQDFRRGMVAPRVYTQAGAAKIAGKHSPEPLQTPDIKLQLEQRGALPVGGSA